MLSALLLPLPLVLAGASSAPLPDQESLEKTSEKVLRDVPPDPLLGENAGEDWSGSLSAGASRSTGAGRPQTLTASGSVTRRGDRHRARLAGFWYHAGQRDSTGEHRTTQRHFGGSLQLDYFFAAKDYFLFNTSGERNLKADLDLRLTSGVGYGRQFAEGERWTVSAEIGGGWFYEDFGGGPPDELGRARLGYHWRWRGDSPLGLEQRGELFPGLRHGDHLQSRLVSQLRYDFGRAVFGQAEWRHEWVNAPAEERERTDQYLVLTLGLKF